MNKIQHKYLDWIDRYQIFDPICLGTMLFVTAAGFMLGGVERGVLHDYDMLSWVQCARQSNAYGDAEETHEAMRQFEKMVSEDIE